MAEMPVTLVEKRHRVHRTTVTASPSALAFRRVADPLGLLNPRKMRDWTL
jgi:hypothetical protein